MNRASWDAATAVQRAQTEDYAAIVDQIPDISALPSRTRNTVTPHLDRLVAVASSCPDGAGVAAVVFKVALTMVGRAHAADAADDLIRLAPEVRARRMSPLDVRNVAVARASRAAQARRATDLVGYTQVDVFDTRQAVVPASPMLSPELIERITTYTEAVYGRPLTDMMRQTLVQGLPCAVELIESYPGNNPAPGAALVSMQARQSGSEGRHLPTLFRDMGMAERVAVALSRVLVGCKRDPTTAILWHGLRDTPLRSIPQATVARLRRDINDLDQAQFTDDLDRAWVRRLLDREVRKEWTPTRPVENEPSGRAVGR